MTSQKLNLGIRQQLNLTAGLFQSLNILQMSNIELSEMLASELVSNPFLEDNSEYGGIESADSTGRYDNIVVRNNLRDDFDSIELVEEQQSLISYVMDQMNGLLDNQVERIIAIYLINLLHESGYIELDIAKAQSDLKISEEAILQVLYKLQKMEPTGIFARNLQECLTLQLKEQKKYDGVFKIILENLDRVAAYDIHKLSRLCKIDKSEIVEYIKILKSLAPKPCVGFAKEYVSSRVADVILTIDESSNEVKLRINSVSASNVTVNKDYYTLAKSHAAGNSDKDIISNYYYSANNIMRSVSQRMNTIKEVAIAIAEKQRDFFLKGVMYLKPMTLSEIAFICGINESTVSRATTNKYIETPTGIYDMKFFFSSSIPSKNNGVSVSSTKVKEIIKSIIDSEDNTHIYSDDEIVEELAKFNINIARRTVAKYRDSLGIETSNIRKRIARSNIM